MIIYVEKVGFISDRRKEEIPNHMLGFDNRRKTQATTFSRQEIVDGLNDSGISISRQPRLRII